MAHCILVARKARLVSVKRIVLLFSLAAAAVAASKPHSIFFGHAMTVKWFTGEKEDKGRASSPWGKSTR